MDKWWTWRWDHKAAEDLSIPYTRIDRWRRGWVTVYRLVSTNEVTWRLYLPFNLHVGFSR